MSFSKGRVGARAAMTTGAEADKLVRIGRIWLVLVESRLNLVQVDQEVFRSGFTGKGAGTHKSEKRRLPDWRSGEERRLDAAGGGFAEISRGSRGSIARGNRNPGLFRLSATRPDFLRIRPTSLSCDVFLRTLPSKASTARSFVGGP
jgi:hypothetical protein